MTIATFTDSDKYTFRVFSSMYIDWGLEITGPEGEELYYSPSSLSNESYGYKPNPERDFVDWEEAQDAAAAGDDDAFVAWDEKDWKECLSHEGDTLLEAYTIHCMSCEKLVNPQNAKLFNSAEYHCVGCSPE
jgi:hypothetical protein